ncbi:MAG: DNA pilot protein [Microviridae sp.]|nr:MAG: DNA pilot protein [Microviridae sp.]
MSSSRITPRSIASSLSTRNPTSCLTPISRCAAPAQCRFSAFLGLSITSDMFELSGDTWTDNLTGETESAGGGGSWISSALGAAGSAFGGPVGGLIGSVVGGLFGKKGASSQNKAAAKAAAAQMAWQERMSNTAHQREVADLRAAGLNPILSANKGGASTPSGASYSPVNEMDSAVSSAKAGRMAAVELENALAQTKLLEAQTQKTQAETETERNRPENIAADTGYKQQGTSELYERTGKTANERGLAAYNRDIREIEARIAQSQLPAMAKQQLRQAIAKTTSDEASAKEAQTRGRISESEIGQILTTLERIFAVLPINRGLGR